MKADVVSLVGVRPIINADLVRSIIHTHFEETICICIDIEPVITRCLQRYSRNGLVSIGIFDIAIYETIRRVEGDVGRYRIITDRHIFYTTSVVGLIPFVCANLIRSVHDRNCIVSIPI